MRGKKTKYLFAMLCTITALGCSREEPCPDSTNGEGARVEMDLGSRTVPTRAHFEDNDGQASFVWDADGQMIAVVSKDGSIAQWDDGKWYSGMNITLIDSADPGKVLRAASASTLNSDAACVGDSIFFFSPVEGSSLVQTASSDAEVDVTFSMPSTFVQSASGRLEEFEPYCFIRGESTVKSAPTASDKNFAANSTTFRAVPATFRFNLRNNSQEDVFMESVKISCNKLFPDKLCWRTDGRSVRICEPEDKSGYFSTIKTTISEGDGELIPARNGENVSKGTYYAMCLPFDDEASMTGATIAFILETKDKIYSFNVPAAELFRNSTRKLFESNKIYTFNFSMNENSIELENVTVSDWIDDPFYLPKEEITAFVQVSASYWVQVRENVYTYEFMRMIGDASNCTLWGECNLGEYLYYAHNEIFTWGSVSSPASLAFYFNNITDFNWQLPSRKDFVQLFSSYNSLVTMTMDEESEEYGLKIESKSNPGVSIFIPCLYMTEANTDFQEDGTEIIHRQYHGKYWTMDEADELNAYVAHFVFGQDVTLKDEVVIDSSPLKWILNDGNDIYEFVKVPKTDKYPVRVILKNE